MINRGEWPKEELTGSLSGRTYEWLRAMSPMSSTPFLGPYERAYLGDTSGSTSTRLTKPDQIQLDSLLAAVRIPKDLRDAAKTDAAKMSLLHANLEAQRKTKTDLGPPKGVEPAKVRPGVLDSSLFDKVIVAKPSTADWSAICSTGDAHGAIQNVCGHLPLQRGEHGGRKLAPIPKDTAYAGEPADDFVKTRIPTVSQDEGFVKITGLSKQIKIPDSLVAEDFGNFCGLVTFAAREVGADRDYLMAVAYESTRKFCSTLVSWAPRTPPG